MNTINFESTDFEALIFDMDGTLVDNMPYHRQTWLEWSKREGIGLPDDEMLALTHGTIGEITRRFFPGASESELFERGERKEALYREMYAPHLALLPGLKEFLDYAREKNLPIALATAGNYTNIAFTIDGLDIRSYFAALVGSEDVTHGKPHPEVFLQAAEKLGVAPEKCLVFEDSPAGAEAARRAGMKSIIVNQMNPREDFDDTSHVLIWSADYRGLI